MAIYDDNTAAITTGNLLILKSDQCQHTGVWRLNLDPANTNTHSHDQHATPKTINVIFDLPSTCKTFLWCHASARFPPKETFIDAIHNGNYATWLKLTVMLNNQYYTDSDETVKGHLKGQCQGIQSTKIKAVEKIIENKTDRIKIEGKKSPSTIFQSPKPTKLFFALRTSPTQFTPTKWERSHSLPNKATDTSWWQSTSMQTTYLSNLCVAGQRNR
jgi:hypothetical protein